MAGRKANAPAVSQWRQKAPHSGPQQAAASGKRTQTLCSACHRKKKGARWNKKQPTVARAVGFIVWMERNTMWCCSMSASIIALQTHYSCCCLIWQIKLLLKPVVFESRDSPFKVLGKWKLIKKQTICLYCLQQVSTKALPKSYFFCTRRAFSVVLLLSLCHLVLMKRLLLQHSDLIFLAVDRQAYTFCFSWWKMTFLMKENLTGMTVKTHLSVYCYFTEKKTKLVNHLSKKSFCIEVPGH